MPIFCLAKLRKKANITQLELAKELGVSKGAVGMWETGKRTPSLSMAKKISRFFNVKVEEIQFYEKKASEESDINVLKEGKLGEYT